MSADHESDFKSLGKAMTVRSQYTARIAAEIFGEAVSNTGAVSWMGVQREIYPLTRPGAQIDIHLNVRRGAPKDAILKAYNFLAQTLPPGSLGLHLYDNLDPAYLRGRLNNPKEYPLSTVVWEGPLNAKSR